MANLEEMLRSASAAESWSHVVHRCAWCKRVFDANGVCSSIVPFDETTIATDGMCPACGARAMSLVRARHRSLAA